MDPTKTHGAFSWSELSTDDPARALAFYGSLFGWRSETMNMGQGAYHLIKVGDEAVGGVMGKMPGERQMPNQWGVYVTVDDIDATAAKCRELGGQVLVEPMAVPGVGRMAVMMDPQGAMFSAMTYSDGAAA